MKRVAILLGSILEKAPYVEYYTEVLDNLDVEYDYYVWNRGGNVNNKTHKNVFVYYDYDGQKNPILKYYKYYKYASWIAKSLKMKHYDYIIVFGLQLSYFLRGILLSKNIKYILDVRDYSPVMRIPHIKYVIKKIINNSQFTGISSPGFLNWLPKNGYYIISHNIKYSIIKQQYSPHPFGKNIRILTIGMIRDYDANRKILEAFGNKDNYSLYFAGASNVAQRLENESKNLRYNNIFFQGYYKKDQELGIVEENDMINIFLPNNTISNYLMSNRFYLSVLMKKPMLVNSGNTQASYVKKYNLGCIIYDSSEIYNAVEEYINEFDIKKYDKGCVDFISEVISDIEHFNKVLSECIIK